MVVNFPVVHFPYNFLVLVFTLNLSYINFLYHFKYYLFTLFQLFLFIYVLKLDHKTEDLGRAVEALVTVITEQEIETTTLDNEIKADEGNTSENSSDETEVTDKITTKSE